MFNESNINHHLNLGLLPEQEYSNYLYTQLILRSRNCKRDELPHTMFRLICALTLMRL